MTMAPSATARGEAARVRSERSRADNSPATSATGLPASAWVWSAARRRARSSRSGVEEDLHVGIGKDDGADVAPLHHHAARPAHRPLPLDQRGADARQPGHRGGRMVDLGRPNVARHVRAVGEHATLHGLDGHLGGERCHGGLIVEREAPADGAPPDDAVHDARIDVAIAERGGDAPGHGSLADAGRPVDGDDERTNHT